MHLQLAFQMAGDEGCIQVAISYSRKAKLAIGEKTAAFCVALEEEEEEEEEEAVVVTAAESMGTLRPLSHSEACLNAGIEATKDKQLVRFRKSSQEDVKVLGEVVPHLVDAAQREGAGVDTDDGG
nr:unnamed protein product [Spirometra erinaceieuropaei]